MLTSLKKSLGADEDAQLHGNSLAGLGEPYAY